MPDEMTPLQKLDAMVQFYKDVGIARNGSDIVVEIGNGPYPRIVGYGRTAEEAITNAYETWKHRRAMRLTSLLLR